MSGTDRPTGGDGGPDRYSRREDRPFPGAPSDREPVSAPGPAPSMEQMRAAYASAGTNAELEAMAKADEAAAAGGTRTPDADSPGERPTESGGDGSAAGTRPGVQDAGSDGIAVPGMDVPGVRQPEGFTRPGWERPPFPVGTRDRGLAPEVPASAPSAEGVRALHERVNSSALFEAVAAEHAGAQKDDSAPRPGGDQDTGALDGLPGHGGDLHDQDATEPGKRDGGERTGPGSQTDTDAVPEPERGRETSGGEDGEGPGDDGQDQKPKDLVQVQDPAPEAETDRSAEAATDVTPDHQVDDPRLAAMETRMAEFASMLESMQAKLDASEARNEKLAAKNEQLEAKVGELETGRQEDHAKLRELEATLEGPDAGREQQGPVEDNEQTESLLNPDVIRSDEHQDDLSAAEQADAAELSDSAEDQPGREAYETSAETERAAFSEDTAQAGQDALSLAGALGIVNPLVSLAVSADSARRKFQKMAPTDQLDVINLTDSATKAFGSMPPETAVVAVTVSTIAPLVGDKLRNAIHHFRRKD